MSPARIALPKALPLVRAVDNGDPVRIDAETIGASGDRWVDPFLQANGPLMKRMDITPEVGTRQGVHVSLQPGSRVGAMPLLSATTRRVAAGLVVAPRFHWSALGAVFQAIGFSVEPSLGGAPMVPGSAREVPAWMLAGTVMNRLDSLLRHRKRAFISKSEVRQSPRGRVDWSTWARRHVPTGNWTSLPCTFSEPDDDPELAAAIRWTLGRLDDELAPLAGASPARLLRERARLLMLEVGPGPARRPASHLFAASGGWIAEALEAMGWVADERGLGGARSLDGLAWDLAIDEVWESWVRSFIRWLGPHTGLVASGRDEVRHRLNWSGAVQSMGALIPDAVLYGPEHTVWIEAKYKAHLSLLARHGWGGLSEAVRGAHRADLHQALAYASLAQVAKVDTVIVYPQLATEAERPATAVATVASGRRRVRLILAGLPFGFTGPEQRERTQAAWKEVLVG